MRGLFLIPILALAACTGENSGWNPNYQMMQTPYGTYLRAREAALTGFRAEPPQVIPVTLPVRAPTPQEIAGPKPVRIAGHVPAVRGGTTTVAVVSAPATAPRPITETGPYPGSTSVLVNYANSARHTPGTTIWPRTNPRDARSICARYPSPATAQTAFLAKGGPTQDPAGMDPDGDGFVCGWNPASYRSDPL
ncbi:MAG TPA: hypothetical protein PLL33_05310 [Paracoccus sp. (in: a-proteobacteria)]|nr:hypothetical protein [Paracoccus sp. (in: a-proteobacteria)]